VEHQEVLVRAVVMVHPVQVELQEQVEHREQVEVQEHLVQGFQQLIMQEKGE
jgi:hypothetical protein